LKKEKANVKAQTVVDASGVIDQLDSKKAELSLLAARVAARLNEEEAAAGNKFLAGDESAIGLCIELRARVDVINAALAELDRRRSVRG